MKLEASFIIFKEFSTARTCLSPKNGPLKQVGPRRRNKNLVKHLSGSSFAKINNGFYLLTTI